MAAICKDHEWESDYSGSVCKACGLFCPGGLALWEDDTYYDSRESDDECDDEDWDDLHRWLLQ